MQRAFYAMAMVISTLAISSLAEGAIILGDTLTYQRTGQSSVLLNTSSYIDVYNTPSNTANLNIGTDTITLTATGNFDPSSPHFITISGIKWSDPNSYITGIDLVQISPDLSSDGFTSSKVTFIAGDEITGDTVQISVGGFVFTSVGASSQVVITLNTELVEDPDPPSSVTPEPASCILWGGLGLVGLVAARRRKKLAAA